MEKLFKLKNGKFLFIQESSEGGWDYTIYNSDKSEFDGGIYDDENISLETAIVEICASFNFDHVDEMTEINYDIEFQDGFVFEV